MFSNDKNITKTVADCFEDLSFEETDEEGVFLIDDNPKCLRVVSGTFNYNDVKDIYDRSKKGS